LYFLFADAADCRYHFAGAAAAASQLVSAPLPLVKNTRRAAADSLRLAQTTNSQHENVL